MYDRDVSSNETGSEAAADAARVLNFEASGALKQASLIMRDRETDSWWSIMTSEAIGGELAGTELVELPVSEKTTWGDWVERHPNTLVLSVDGREHVDVNPYDNYFASSGTFRDLQIKDDRLPPKEPIFAVWGADFGLGGTTFVVPHAVASGGAVLPVPGLTDAVLVVQRQASAPLFASTAAWLVPRETAAGRTAGELAEGLGSGDLSAPPVTGIDTFWYNWIAVNEGAVILGRD